MEAAKNSTLVTLVSRKPIDASMSDYVVEGIRAHPRIVVKEGSEIAGYAGGKVSLKNGQQIDAKAVGVFFGGSPKTDWVPKSIERSAKGHIITKSGLETHMPGVFAVGDVRQGAIGRIGTSVGDGQFATHSIFQYFEGLKRMGKAFGPKKAKG